MEIEQWPEDRWVVRFTHNIDLTEAGVVERLAPVLHSGCRHLLIDLSEIPRISLLEVDSLYVLRAAAVRVGATVEIVNPPPKLLELLEALVGREVR